MWRAQQEEGKELDMDAFWDHVQVRGCIWARMCGKEGGSSPCD